MSVYAHITSLLLPPLSTLSAYLSLHHLSTLPNRYMLEAVGLEFRRAIAKPSPALRTTVAAIFAEEVGFTTGEGGKLKPLAGAAPPLTNAALVRLFTRLEAAVRSESPKDAVQPKSVGKTGASSTRGAEKMEELAEPAKIASVYGGPPGMGAAAAAVSGAMQAAGVGEGFETRLAQGPTREGAVGFGARSAAPSRWTR